MPRAGVSQAAQPFFAVLIHKIFPARPIVIVTPKVEQLYPILADGLTGRVVNVDWLGDPGGYQMYYALFVK